MNMPTASRPSDTGPRRLDDDVFQTAEEAVLVEGQGNGFATAAAARTGPAAANARRGGSSGSSFTQAIGAHVAARPCQSALLAAAAGALAMLVLRSRLRGRLPPWRLAPAEMRPGAGPRFAMEIQGNFYAPASSRSRSPAPARHTGHSRTERGSAADHSA